MGENRRPDDSRYQRLPPPLDREVAPIADRYNIRWGVSGRVLFIDDVELPAGFSPRAITMQINVPSTYPRAPPRVELPWCIRHHGAVPRSMLVSGRWLVRGSLGDPIIFWPEWAQSNTLTDVVEQVQTNLARMDEEDHPVFPNNAPNDDDQQTPRNPQ